MGDVNPDIILPLHSQDRLRAEVSGGGTVANTASGLGRLGIPVSFFGMTGNDAYGMLMEKLLADDGVDTSHLLHTDRAATNMVMAVVEETGERSIFVWPEAGAAQSFLSIDDIAFSLENFSFLHVSSINLHESPSAEAVIEAVRRCREKGIIVSFDLNLRPEFFTQGSVFLDRVWEIIGLADIILGSWEEEIRPLSRKQSIEEAARQLNPEAALVSRRGAEGASCFVNGKEYSCRPYPIIPLDTTGAGDAFNSGFLAARWFGKSWEDALVWGNACGAHSITGSSARSCPDLLGMCSLIRRFEGDRADEICTIEV